MKKKPKITNKEVTVYKDTVYAQLRRQLYDAVQNNNPLLGNQWDNGRCYIYAACGERYCPEQRGVIAKLQPKINGKGWIVYFEVCMIGHWPDRTTGRINQTKKPFFVDVNAKLLVNETPSGTRLLWLVKDKKTKKFQPLWRRENWDRHISVQFHYTQEIIGSVLLEISKIYSPTDFIPILKYIKLPHTAAVIEDCTTNTHGNPWLLEEPSMKSISAPYPAYSKCLHNLHNEHIMRYQNGTNPKDILNMMYGTTFKDGTKKKDQLGLSKNAFGGINKINDFNTFIVIGDLVRIFKSFPSAFFDKIKVAHTFIPAYGTKYMVQGESLPRMMYCLEEVMSRSDVECLQYFFKHFRHRKVQEEFIRYINTFPAHEAAPNDVAPTGHNFFRGNLWTLATDSARNLKIIGRINTIVKRNLLTCKGTVQEIHDLISLEYNKLFDENKPINYSKNRKMLDDQKVTDNIISVLPKNTHELIEWGSAQNNCLGSYGHMVIDRSTIIIGFKDIITNQWIGHAQITKDFDCYYLNQLRGIRNQLLNEKDEKVICEFLKRTIEIWGCTFESHLSRF